MTSCTRITAPSCAPGLVRSFVDLGSGPMGSPRALHAAKLDSMSKGANLNTGVVTRSSCGISHDARPCRLSGASPSFRQINGCLGLFATVTVLPSRFGGNLEVVDAR